MTGFPAKGSQKLLRDVTSGFPPKGLKEKAICSLRREKQKPLIAHGKARDTVVPLLSKMKSFYNHSVSQKTRCRPSFEDPFNFYINKMTLSPRVGTVGPLAAVLILLLLTSIAAIAYYRQVVAMVAVKTINCYWTQIQLFDLLLLFTGLTHLHVICWSNLDFTFICIFKPVLQWTETHHSRKIVHAKNC